MKPALNTFFPRFIVTIDRGSGRPLNFHPTAVLLAFVVAVGLLLYAGFRLSFSAGHKDALAEQSDTLRTAQLQLQLRLARSQAELGLRNVQISGLKQQIRQDIQDSELTRKRLAMFDDVLAARRVRGVHVLHPEAQWQKDDGIIKYQLVLVKGENYPRWALGHLQFSTRMPDGKIIILSNPQGKTSIKYEMTTHLFMQGRLLWHKKTAPASLHVILINHRNKQIRQADLPVLSVSSMPVSDHAPVQAQQP